ncbi:hypothetical protein J7E38_18200 [Bacillus sp. ISL-35]|uniref:hypothetical protein n=1 Tax=Bacillus sp. ISL-35 TaxID=2819122 RepID=UPI001BEB5FA9|nr:hypothetical protein [Bacillus sp. ISL-35]MBT2680926.1 hypothetical protein [Bacillus sp. ISL-35]MBT2705243.1 hypothetical protein [Chryseobacterium sp. ISL-80]
MPGGKELEQLPMANLLPGMGDDRSNYNREVLTGISENDGAKPEKVTEKNGNNW